MYFTAQVVERQVRHSVAVGPRVGQRSQRIATSSAQARAAVVAVRIAAGCRVGGNDVTRGLHDVTDDACCVGDARLVGAKLAALVCAQFLQPTLAVLAYQHLQTTSV